MAQNTLKQKARAFAKERGVSYLSALKAVDEPLHDLRDLLREVRIRSDALQHHFRLIGDKGPYSPAYPAPLDEEYRKFGERTATRDYHRRLINSERLQSLSESDFFIEFGRRTALLRDRGIEDIWEYRELQRSGLLGDTPQLEPLFHHYSMGIPESFGALIYSGSQLGIFGVNMASYVQIDRFQFIPVTPAQLDSLRNGVALDRPVEFSMNHLSSKDHPNLKWDESYVAAYGYDDPLVTGYRTPRLTVLLRSFSVDLEAELSARGLDASQLHEDESFSVGIDLSHKLSRDMLRIRDKGGRTHWIVTPGLIVLG